jgi:hypothetical protein
LVGVGLALILAIRAFVELRRAEYYVVREEARRSALRALALVALLTLLTLSFLFVPRRAPAPTPTPTATFLPSPTVVSSVATVTPSTPPTLTPTSEATPLPTATEPFIPTQTPQATLPVTFTTPLPSAVPPPADASIELWTLAQDVDENSQPVTPGSQFPAGVEQISLFFRYDGLLPNVPVTTLWYREGELLSGGPTLWERENATGAGYLFLSLENGFPVGQYEVQMWLDNRLQIRSFFSVVQAEG